MPASRTRARKGREDLLIEKAVNRAIEDGFRPYDPDAPDAAGNVCAEVERRLYLPEGYVAKALLEGRIIQNCSLYNEEDPTGELRRVWLNAGFEATGDKNVRQKILVMSDEMKKLKKMLQKADHEEITAARVREEIYGLRNTPPVIPSRIYQPKLSKKSPGIPMVEWCDWHFGEGVSLAESRGFNQTDKKRTKKRIHTLVLEEKRAFEYYSPSMNYPGVVVVIAGDLFSGDGLHQEIDLTNESRTIELFSELQGEMIWGLRELADAFGYVYAVCVVGNHGRTTPKPMTKLVTATNYEFLLYNQLELFFKNDLKYRNKVEFNIPLSVGTSFVVGADPKNNYRGHRYYATHGERMGAKGGRGQIGVIGPIVRGALNIKRIEAKRGKPCDTVVIGHYHDENFLPDVISGGTLKGPDGFSLDTIGAAPKPPSQPVWLNHKQYGPIIRQSIIVDDLQNPDDDSDSPHIFSGPTRNGNGNGKKKPSPLGLAA